MNKSEPTSRAPYLRDVMQAIRAGGVCEVCLSWYTHMLVCVTGLQMADCPGFGGGHLGLPLAGSPDPQRDTLLFPAVIEYQTLQDTAEHQAERIKNQSGLNRVNDSNVTGGTTMFRCGHASTKILYGGDYQQ